MKARDEWIKETQMFQRIAKVPVSSDEDLAIAYDQDRDDRKVSRIARGLAGLKKLR